MFGRQTLNSLIITAGTVLICLVIGSLAGYAISKLAPPRWILIPCVAAAALIPLIPPIMRERHAKTELTSRTDCVAEEIAQSDLWFVLISLPVRYGQPQQTDPAVGANDGDQLCPVAFRRH